jgi:hypothetical protein
VNRFPGSPDLLFHIRMFYFSDQQFEKSGYRLDFFCVEIKPFSCLLKIRLQPVEYVNDEYSLSK